MGSQAITSKQIVFLSLKIVFFMANSEEQDEMLHILVFTVCQSRHLGVNSSIQRVNLEQPLMTLKIYIHLRLVQLNANDLP